MGIRSQIQKRNRFVSEKRGINTRHFALICILSCAIHLLFFLGLLWFHHFDFQRPRPRVVTVDLVSIVPGPTGGAPEPEVVQKKTAPDKTADVNLNTRPVEPKAPEPAPISVLKPDVSLKTKPKNIKELMAAREKKAEPEPKKQKPKAKPKPDPEKELKKARQALSEKVEKQTQKQINQALERMKSAISEKESKGGQGVGEGPGGGRNVSDPEKLYQMILASTIRQNWVFNDILARMDKKLECRVLVKILKDGEIRDIIFETRSGNQYLDESVKKAILRSNPLPALPMGWRSYDIGFVFSPKGLK